MVFLAGAVVVTLAAVTVVLRLWQSDPGVPYVYFFDGLFHATTVKSVADHGWFLSNPDLGAPSGLHLHDFPMGGENLQFAMIKVLTLFSDDWAVVMNAYFLAGFALIAACAHAVFRQIGASRWTAPAMAILFSLLPYHFVLGESQLFQSTYVAVPLGAFLVFDAMGWDVWRAPFLARASAGRRHASVVRWVVRGALVGVVASAGSYYAPFTMVLVAFASVLALLAGTRRAAVRAMVVVVGLGLVLTANVAPSLLYRIEHGRNAEVANRAPGESDLYALRLVDLFLPATAHRLEPLARVKVRLDSFWPVSPVWPAPQSPLGLAGATGLALSLAAVVTATRSRRRNDPGRVRLAQLGTLNLVAILVAVSTGFSSLLALAGVTQVRVWSRMSVFIAFFALAALGLVVQSSVPRLLALGPVRRLGPAGGRALGVLAGVGVCMAVLDQTQPAVVPNYAGIGAVFGDDRAFVEEIERRMPPGAAVFQLPIATFPEGGAVAGMTDYSLFRGYLHSRDLRWSYGAMRGRPADWARGLEGRPAQAVLDAATAAGFVGLYVDRAGFIDGGRKLEAELRQLVGPPAVVNAHGLAFWDLRERAVAQRRQLGPERLAALRRLVLAPVVPRWARHFGTPLATSSADRPAGPTGQPVAAERPARSPAVLELVNPLPEPRPVRVRLIVRAQGWVSGTIRIIGPDGAAGVQVGAEAQPVELDVVLPPGRTGLRIASATPYFFASQLMVVDTDPAAPHGAGG